MSVLLLFWLDLSPLRADHRGSKVHDGLDLFPSSLGM